MLVLIKLSLVLGATAAGYLVSRRFVADRLRFVDAVQRRRAPWIAGALATLVALPIAWVLPLIGSGTALLFGVAVGTGVAHGTREIRRLEGGGEI